MDRVQFALLMSGLFLIGHNIDGDNGSLLLVSVLWLIMAAIEIFSKGRR